MDNLEQILEEILCSAYTKLIYHEEKILKNLNSLTLKECHTLDVIYYTMRSHSNTSSNIAQILNITLGTLTTNIDRLMEKGYVRREKSEKDKRISVIILTEEGMNIRKKHENSHKKIVRTAIEKLSTSEKVALMNAINKIEM